jgi:hypothetical protein
LFAPSVIEDSQMQNTQLLIVTVCAHMVPTAFKRLTGYRLCMNREKLGANVMIRLS